jgi:hypothetical protein
MKRFARLDRKVSSSAKASVAHSVSPDADPIHHMIDPAFFLSLERLQYPAG